MMTVKFLEQTWQEIPEQDNPAIEYHRNKSGALVKDECIMIFKGRYPRISNGGFVVARVPERGDITKLGVFWTVANAEIFADAVANTEDVG